MFDELPERVDAVNILPGGDGRIQRIGHFGQPLIVVVGHHILQPVEVVFLHLPPDGDGLVDAP